MRDPRTRVSWIVLALALVFGAAATPLHGAAAWQGLQIETGVSLDLQRAQSQVVLDLPASAFSFDPVAVSVDDNPKKSTKAVAMKFKVTNNSDKDYFVYATATLVDAEGKTLASQDAKEKVDDEDDAHFKIKFKLSYAEIERVKTCKLRFAFEKE